MKVIFVNRFFYPDHSATSQLLSDLASELAADNYEVSVITSRQRIDDPDANLPARERVEEVSVLRVWTTRSGRDSMTGRALDYLSFYAAAGWRLFWACAPGDVVVAKTDPPLLSVPCAWIATFRGARLVNWLHDLFPEVAERLGVGGVSGWRANLLRKFRNASLRSAEVNVVLGERMAEELRAQGISEPRIRIIHNWCDGERVRPVPRARNALRKEWGLGKRFVVMYSGNLGRAHEFETLLEAAGALRGRNDVAFLIVGDGVQRAHVETEVSRRKLSNVALMPYQPRARLAESLSAADVHLISLRPALEGVIVPSKFYGVAAAGRPTIFVGAADGEIARLLARHGCGVTVEPGDGESLAAQISALADDPDAAARQGRAARKLFDEYFDKPIAAAAWRRTLGL